jgi:hypothetical protein
MHSPRILACKFAALGLNCQVLLLDLRLLLFEHYPLNFDL